VLPVDNPFYPKIIGDKYIVRLKIRMSDSWAIQSRIAVREKARRNLDIFL